MTKVTSKRVRFRFIGKGKPMVFFENQEIDDGGPAFPTRGSAFEIPGLTIRDYFAAHAITDDCDRVERVAARAYEIADAMLKARMRPS